MTPVILPGAGGIRYLLAGPVLALTTLRVQDGLFTARIVACNDPLRKAVTAGPLLATFRISVDQVDTRSMTPIGMIEIKVLGYKAGAVMQKYQSGNVRALHRLSYLPIRLTAPGKHMDRIAQLSNLQDSQHQKCKNNSSAANLPALRQQARSPRRKQDKGKEGFKMKSLTKEDRVTFRVKQICEH